MAVFNWYKSLTTGKWKVKDFQIQPVTSLNTDSSCMWKTSVLIVSVFFSLCPPSPHRGELVVPARNHIPVTDVPGGNVAVQGAWIEKYGRGTDKCGESEGQEKEYKGKSLGPTVCVIKDGSALFDITRRAGLPASLPLSHTHLDPTVLLGITSQFPLLSAPHISCK